MLNNPAGFETGLSKRSEMDGWFNFGNKLEIKFSVRAII